MELELKHLAPYLPYGLKIWNIDMGVDFDLTIQEEDEGIDMESILYSQCNWKLILRPLSDLTKADLINAGFDYQIDWLTHERDSHVKFYGSLEKFINKTDFGHVQYLISKHYDVFGLIEQGLAININDLQHFQSC